MKSFENGRIFDCELAEDKKTVRVREKCDSYFYEDMTPAQFDALIAEMVDIRKQMVE